MNNDMVDRNDIIEDLITFINIIKEFENGYEFIKHNDIDYMDYEAMDYDYSDIEYLEDEYEVSLSSFDMEDKWCEIPDTWLEEIEVFTEKLNSIDTDNLIVISKIINLGRDLINNNSEKLILIQNDYIENDFIYENDYCYEDRDEIIEDLFSKKGEFLVRCAELGAKKLNLI